MSKLVASALVCALAACTVYFTGWFDRKSNDDGVAKLCGRGTQSDFNVTVVRHGETDFNVKKLIHSSSDGTINSNGVQQARKLGRTLTNHKFTRIYSSDLQRCQDTAQHVLSELQTPIPEIVLDRRLRERDYGEWDGQPSELIFKTAKERNCDVGDVTAPKGETFEESFSRVVSFLEELLKTADSAENEENVLIFSHGITIQYMLGYFNLKQDLYDLENFNFDRWKFASNTAVTRFSVGKPGCGKEEKRRIVFSCVHDASHLQTP